jgi:hypothetical protein
MADVNGAIRRSEETWSPNLSSGEMREAYTDRALLAAEVKELWHACDQWHVLVEDLRGSLRRRLEVERALNLQRGEMRQERDQARDERDRLEEVRQRDEKFIKELRAENYRLARQVEAVRAAWGGYADADMGEVPWRLQRDMNAALALTEVS